MIRLHHVPQARSFRTLWLLHELGLEFETVYHSFFDRSLRDPDYLVLSPAGRVPALEIDGQVMFESGAITEYLVETRAESGLGRLPGNGERVEWLEWLHFSETIGQHIAILTQQHIVLREDWMRSPTVMKLEAKRLEKCFEVVERVVARHEYLLASGFSAVDVNLGYGLFIGQRFAPLSLMPRLEGYMQRLATRPAFKAALADDGAAEIYKRDFYEVPDV